MKAITMYSTSVAFLFVLLLSSCATANYIGDRFEPTSDVDVYYSARDVDKKYKVIGHISERAISSRDDSKKGILAKAKAVGADGVIIVGTEHTGGEDVRRFNKAEAIKYNK